MLTLDFRNLGIAVVVDGLKSILVFTSLELILLISNSILIVLKVGIGCILGGGGGSEISVLSIKDVDLLNVIIEGIELIVKSGFLIRGGLGISCLCSIELIRFVVLQLMSGISCSLGLGGICICFSGSSSLSLCGGLVLGGGCLGCNSGIVGESLLVVVILGFIEGWDIKVVWETLVAPFTIK